MSNIACVHFENGKEHEFFHLDRTRPTRNTIFNHPDAVICDRSGQEAKMIYKKLFAERKAIYERNTGQKLQKNTVPLISFVLNVKDTTTMEDLKKFAKKIEEEFDTVCLQKAIHRDEGHIDPLTGQEKVNHHAHLLFLGLNSQGKSIKRQINKRSVKKKMQDWAAEILQMQRGEERKKTKRRRLNTYEYKEAMKLKDKEIKKLAKMVKEKEKKIRKILYFIEEHNMQNIKKIFKIIAEDKEEKSVIKLGNYIIDRHEAIRLLYGKKILIKDNKKIEINYKNFLDYLEDLQNISVFKPKKYERDINLYDNEQSPEI